MRFAPLLILLALCSPLVAAETRADDVDFTDLSIEELMAIEVRSVSKRDQPIRDAAAAVYILTAEDIRRSGATSVPEALRMVPGMQVGRINASAWAISARGFRERFANKMLVLRDGRSLYSPLFGGVFWDVQDILLEDVERIEVIRGPGGTLWGANAVNGVINIITRPASKTRGNHAALLYGPEERRAEFRHGGSLGPRGDFRVHAQAFEHDDQVSLSGNEANDGWDFASVGFRADWTTRSGDAVTLEGDGFAGSPVLRMTEPLLVPPFSTSFDDEIDADGFNVLTRWSRSLPSGNGMQLQAFFEQTDRDARQYSELRHTVDVEFQHGFGLGERHDLLWGVGARRTSDELISGAATSFSTAERDDETFSGFIQDDISFADGRLVLTIGSKFEHNDYSGFEVQPNVRGLWRVGDEDALWVAVSRAIRSPTRAFSDVRLDIQAFPDLFGGGPTMLVSVFGNPELESETLVAYEAGYRGCAGQSVCYDLSAFFNDYDEMIGAQPLAPFLELTPPPPHVVLPQLLVGSEANTAFGAEMALTWSPSSRFRAHFWYAYLDLQRDIAPAPDDARNEERFNAEHLGHARFQLDVSQKMSVDLLAYYSSELPISPLAVDARTRVDARVAWRALDGLELSAVVQNAFDDEQPEFTGDLFAAPTLFERSVYAKLRWGF